MTTRRQFLQTGAAAAATLSTGILRARADEPGVSAT